MSESTVDPKKKPQAISKTASKAPVTSPSPKSAMAVPKSTPPKAEVMVKPTPAASKPAGEKTPVKAEKIATPPAVAQATSASTAKPKAPRKAPAAKAQVPNQDAIDKMVAEAAYYLAEKRNFATGFEEEDWLAAKKQIMAQLKGAKKPQD